MDLLFFYKEPSREREVYEADRDIMVSEPIENPCGLLHHSTESSQEEGKAESIVHMMSSTREVFAKVRDSGDVSSPIITFTHGSKGSFSLMQRNKMLEFGYYTNMYRNSSTESLYTKITTVLPRYIVVNYTQSTMLFAQDSAKGNPLFVKSGQQTAFHWNDKNSEKLLSVQVIPSEARYAQQ